MLDFVIRRHDECAMIVQFDSYCVCDDNKRNEFLLLHLRTFVHFRCPKRNNINVALDRSTLLFEYELFRGWLLNRIY